MKDFKSIIKNLKKSWKYIKESKTKLVLCIIASIVLCAISVITPLLSAKMLLFITDGKLKDLLIISITVFVVEITRNIFSFIYNIFFQKYVLETSSSLQIEVAKETMKLEISEIDKQSSGVFIDRLSSDTREIVNIFSDLSDSVIEVIGNIGILMAILTVNIEMFIYFLIAIVLLFILEEIRMKAFFKADKKIRRLKENNTGLVGELVRGMRDIKTLNIDENFLNKSKERLIESNKENYKMRKKDFLLRFFIGNVKDILQLVFVILGIYLILNNRLSAASFVIIYVYKDRLLELLRYFTYVIELLKRFDVSATRVFEVIDDEVFKKEKFGLKQIDKVNGDFEFKDVSFSYNEENIVLRNLNFKINSNETVAFVGKSGSGKSTIFSLLNRLYQIDSGEILIDGININELTKDSIRNNMSIITQNPYIFNFSIKENLKLVKPDMTDEEMVYVCKTACLHDFIMALKDGYDTKVGEGGVTLSGGQKQRLAIARALLKKTEIILFDEATSALDNETQEDIQKAINNMKGEYTILIIAHRLSTVIDSDRIILIDNGKVVGEGTHEKLIKNNEYYKNLYNKELI